MKITRKKKQSKLEEEINSVLEEMSVLDKDSEEYETMLGNLETLYKAKSYEKPSGISADTLLIVGGNLVGIYLILNYEKLNIISSKAIGFVLKGRV